MAFESVRSYVQLASGLGEMTKARAMEAAQGLLSLPGADEVTRRAVRASVLADQLLEAAKANRASLLSLVQHEVEAALKRADVARVADVRAAQVTVAALAKEIADLRGMVRAGGAMVGRRSGAVSTTARATAPTAEPTATATVSPIGSTQPSAPAGGRRTSARTASKTRGATKTAPAKKTAAKKATGSTPAKRAIATKTAKRSTAKTAAKKSTTAKSAAKKTTARKTTAKKAAATRGNTTTTKAGS